MRVSVYIDKSVALCAGKDVWGRRVVDMPSADLGDEGRDTLARFGDYVLSKTEYERTTGKKAAPYGAGICYAAEAYADADFFLEYAGPVHANGGTREYAGILRPICTEPTPEVVLLCLAAIRAEDARIAQEATDKKAADEAEYQKGLQRILATPIEELIHQDRYGNVEKLDNGGEWHRESKWKVNSMPHGESAKCLDGIRGDAQRLADERNAAALATVLASVDEANAVLATQAGAELVASIAKRDHRSAWVAEYGTDSMRDRQEADMLDEKEVLAAVRNWLFAPLIDWERYDRMALSDVCICEDPNDCRVSFEAEDADSCSAEEFDKLKEAKRLLPEATATIREHVGTTDDCDNAETRRSLHVSHEWGPYTLSREFAV